MPKRRKNRSQRFKKEPFELDITSLLDILVILLVFLLKSYNESGMLITIPDNLEVPKSKESSINTAGVVVQISRDKMWVDDKVVYEFGKDDGGRFLNRSQTTIIPLYNQLRQKRSEVLNLQKATNNAIEFSGLVNLIIDKSYRYSFLKQVMHTCAIAGFKQYKFVVMGKKE